MTRTKLKARMSAVAMKESGVQWLGEIPAHWDVKPVYTLTLATDKRDPSQKPYTEFRYIDVSSISSELNQISAFEELMGYDAPTRARNVVFEGDTIFATVRPYLRNIALIPIELHDSICSTGYCVLRPERIKLKSCYLFYSCISAGFVASVEVHQQGVSYPAVSDRVVRRQVIPLPPLHEQRAIASYLDRETAKIDSLIGETEALNALLSEKRVALISRAVTKGLGAGVEMKESGVEWLGEIPAHWDVKRLKFVGESIIGLTYSPTDVTDEANGILVLRASNIQNGRLAFYDAVYVDTKIPKKLFTREDDILICSRSGSRALIGKNAKITGRAVGVSFGAFMTVFRSQYSDYLSYVFDSTLFEQQSSLFMTSTINQLTISILNNIQVSFPPLHEQRAIAEYLDRETARIDALIKKNDELIALLREKRTALISAAVTGKIEVDLTPAPAPPGG